MAAKDSSPDLAAGRRTRDPGTVAQAGSAELRLLDHPAAITDRPGPAWCGRWRWWSRAGAGGVNCGPAGAGEAGGRGSGAFRAELWV